MVVTKAHLENAKEKRDVEFLLRLVRTNAQMEQDVREYLVEILADLINRKIKRPAHRPAKSETAQRRYLIAERVLEIEREADRKKISQTVVEVAREFGKSTSFVYGCLKVNRDEIEEEWREQEEQQRYKNYEPDWELDFPEHEPEPTDEEIEAAGDWYIQMEIDRRRGK
jgi:hypothetical protein